MHIYKEVLCVVVVFELLNTTLTLRMQEFDLQILEIVNLGNDPCCQQRLHIPEKLNVFIKDF